jgi:hypothetical protein
MKVQQKSARSTKTNTTKPTAKVIPPAFEEAVYNIADILRVADCALAVPVDETERGSIRCVLFQATNRVVGLLDLLQADGGR